MHDILTLLKDHGVMLASGRGPVPNVADAIAGEAIRGSWWGHAQGKRIFDALQAIEACEDVLVCRVVVGKRSFVHARLWPALVRCAMRFPQERLAWTRERHTASGRHVREDTPFPVWVPAVTLRASEGLDEEDALRMLGAWAR